MKKLFLPILALFLLAYLIGSAGIALAAASSSPFSVSQSSFNFFYAQGGGLPSPQSVTFTNDTDSIIYYTIDVPNQPHWLNTGYATDTLPAYPGSPSGIGASADVTNLAVGTYTTAIYIRGNFAGAALVFPITLTVAPAGTPLPGNQAHPDGTNILTSGGTIYRIILGARQPYTSAGAFLSYGYNTWAGVVPANSYDLALPIGSAGTGGVAFIPPRDGSLIKDHGTVYIISDGYRVGFTSAEVFLGLGYSFADVLDGDTSFLTTLTPINTSQMAHSSGTVINDRGTICIIESVFRAQGTPGRRCFSNLSDMNSWGIKASDMVTANNFDQGLQIKSIVQSRGQYSALNP